MTTQVDFYLLATTDINQIYQSACELAEGCFQKQQRVCLYDDTPDGVQLLDTLLWSFRDDSFVPHAIYQPQLPVATPILLVTSGTLPPPGLQTLINLTQTVPVFYADFQQVIELIGEQPSRREAGRERYRFYKEQRCQLVTHK